MTVAENDFESFFSFVPSSELGQPQYKIVERGVVLAKLRLFVKGIQDLRHLIDVVVAKYEGASASEIFFTEALSDLQAVRTMGMEIREIYPSFVEGLRLAGEQGFDVPQEMQDYLPSPASPPSEPPSPS